LAEHAADLPAGAGRVEASDPDLDFAGGDLVDPDGAEASLDLPERPGHPLAAAALPRPEHPVVADQLRHRREDGGVAGLGEERVDARLGGRLGVAAGGIAATHWPSRSRSPSGTRNR
jgi:hypothetical protein